MGCRRGRKGRRDERVKGRSGCMPNRAGDRWMTSKRARYPVCAANELPPGARKIVEMAGKSIGIFNVAGKYVAVLNVCPHELAPVCAGSLTGVTSAPRPGAIGYAREGEIL